MLAIYDENDLYGGCIMPKIVAILCLVLLEDNDLFNSEFTVL